MTERTPTEQQNTAIAMAVAEACLKMEAGAGCGKTSTLEMVAKAIKEPSLYVAFNKVTAEEAEQRFPSHVTAKTTHSLAYRSIGHTLMHKLSRPKGAYKNVAGTGSEIAWYYHIEGVEDVVSEAAIGAFVKQTVERFEQSADNELSAKHVPRKDMEKILMLEPWLAAAVLKYAKRLWKDRTDLASPVLATHDTYLKLYQLSKPVLPYKVVYADEFQDTTPCVLDIIMNQQSHAKIVMVGDRRQAIYGWRGAINAMQSVQCATAPLSVSFRYGQGIADVATHVLKGDMKLTGTSAETLVGFNVVDRTKPHAFLFRSNSALLAAAVEAIDKGEKVAVEIDVKDFVAVLKSAQALFDAFKAPTKPEAKAFMKQVKHERILPYANWKRFKEEAEEVGGEMKRLEGIVEGGLTGHYIDVLEGYKAPENPVATYTTAHKSKGREWEQVILADDFPSHYKKDGEYCGLSEAEENLLYVAVTRAKRVLEINGPVQEALELAKHGYTVPGSEAEYWRIRKEYDAGAHYDEGEEDEPEERDCKLAHYKLYGSDAPYLMPDIDRHFRREQREVNRIIFGDD